MKIYVIKNNMPIGILTENNLGEIKFEYHSDIMPDQYLPGLKESINVSTKLFPVFENLLPEHAQLALLKAKHNVTSAIGTLLYLDDIHGTFEFNKHNLLSTAARNDIFYYSQVKNTLLDNNYTFPNILHDYVLEISDEQLYPSGLTGSKLIGLSGYQYKFSVNKDDNQKRIYQLNDGDSNFIMKPYNLYHSKFTPKIPNSVYIPYLLINEHLFMTIARDFGFDVPYNAIIKHGEDYHYIIKRYDRKNNLKIDHYEILTLLERNAEAKYDITCKEVIELCNKHLHKNDLLQLFRFIVFSVIIAHGDLHAKNISLILKSNNSNETEMELAPFYDISTSAIYYDVEKNDIGMKIKNKKKGVLLEDLLWLAEIAQIEQQQATEIIRDISIRFIKEFKTYINKLPNDIKNLPFYAKKSIYSTRKSFVNVFDKYYQHRCTYIRQYLSIDYKEENLLWD